MRNYMYINLLPTSSLVSPQKVYHSDTNSCNGHTTTLETVETRLYLFVKINLVKPLSDFNNNPIV